MFSRRRKILGLVLGLSDTAVTAVAFELAYILRQHIESFRLFYLERGVFVGVLIGILATWGIVGAVLGLYRRAELFDAPQLVRDTIRQAFWGAALLICWLYVLKLGEISRSFVFLFVAISTFLLLVTRLSARSLRRLRRREPLGRRYYVIVGTGEKAVEVAYLMEASEDLGHRVMAFVRERPPEQPGADAAAGPHGVPGERGWLEAAQLRRRYPVRDLSELPEMLHDHAVDEVIFAVSKRDIEQMEDLLLVCEEEGVKVRILMNFFPHLAGQVSLEKLYTLPLLTFSTTPENEYLLFLKRVLDVLMAAALLVVAAPFFVVVAVAIALTSPGPIIYSQIRCGLNGRRFRLYKFRSMCRDADLRRTEVAHLNETDGPVFKCAHDPRVAPVGHFLRKFSIDEWPQLINILAGNMSFVGPRPPLPEEVQRYERWQRRRLRMKPGLTCLWALEGRHKLDFLSWMRLDLHYIDHWSLLLDIKILLRSIPHVLSGKGV
jgi:exopolysaccharide biosynthesis polyprenyl glycosylphosphotransferase